MKVKDWAVFIGVGALAVLAFGLIMIPLAAIDTLIDKITGNSQ